MIEMKCDECGKEIPRNSASGVSIKVCGNTTWIVTLSAEQESSTGKRGELCLDCLCKLANAEVLT